MNLTIVAAYDETRVIGNDGRVPWSLPEDKEHYQSLVANHPLIAGRKTYGGGRIEGCHYAVMSRTERVYDEDYAYHAGSAREAMDICLEHLKPEQDTVYVFGGAEIYELFLPFCTNMVISHVDGEHEGDTLFPEWDATNWVVTDEDVRDGFTIRYYEQDDPQPLSELPSR